MVTVGTVNSELWSIPSEVNIPTSRRKHRDVRTGHPLDSFGGEFDFFAQSFQLLRVLGRVAEAGCFVG